MFIHALTIHSVHIATMVQQHHLKDDLHGCVLLLQILHLFLDQRHVDRTNQVLQFLDGRRPDDGRSDARFGKEPGERDLRHRRALFLRELLNAVVDMMVSTWVRRERVWYIDRGTMSRPPPSDR